MLAARRLLRQNLPARNRAAPPQRHRWQSVLQEKQLEDCPPVSDQHLVPPCCPVRQEEAGHRLASGARQCSLRTLPSGTLPVQALRQYQKPCLLRTGLPPSPRTPGDRLQKDRWLLLLRQPFRPVAKTQETADLLTALPQAQGRRRQQAPVLDREYLPLTGWPSALLRSAGSVVLVPQPELLPEHQPYHWPDRLPGKGARSRCSRPLPLLAKAPKA
jgi:hypothetical protein